MNVWEFVGGEGGREREREGGREEGRKGGREGGVPYVCE